MEECDRFDATEIAISTIAGGALSQDGEALLLMTTTDTGAEVILSVHKSQLSQLLAITAATRTASRRHQGLPANETEEMLVVKQYALGRDSATRIPVLMLTLANEGRLAFQLTDEFLVGLHETLQSMAAGAVPLALPAGPAN